MSVFSKTINLTGQGVDADSPVDADGLYTLPLIMWANNRISVQRSQWTERGAVTSKAAIKLSGPFGNYEGQTVPARDDKGKPIVDEKGKPVMLPILDDLETSIEPVIAGQTSGHGLFTHVDGHTEEANWDLTVWVRDDTGELYGTVSLWTESPYVIWFGRSPDYVLKPHSVARITIESK